MVMKTERKFYYGENSRSNIKQAKENESFVFGCTFPNISKQTINVTSKSQF